MNARSRGETWRRLCDLRVRLRDRCDEPLPLASLGSEIGLSGCRFLRRGNLIQIHARRRAG